MENVRMAILSADEKIYAFFDNSIPGAMHYREASLHTYLQGSAYTMKIETDTYSEDTQYLVEGNKIAFVYKSRDYMCNIVSVERTETDITIDCLGLLLELTNETRDAYKSNGAMTLQQYINYVDPEHVLTLGINEVSDKSISNEWTGSQTVLARLYSIATLFDAELEFITELNNDYSLKQITLNVYREHDNNYQGIGANRTDQILRFGTTIDVIRKKTDITDLYTAIHPTGKGGLDISSLNGREVKDKDGNIEFVVAYGNIYAKQARARFPSAVGKEGYIGRDWTYDTENLEALYGQALATLKKNCVPQVTYEITGYYDANIGDTFTIVDDGYNPMLILEARVTEQEEYFVDPTKNQTTYSNVIELQSEISPNLLTAMQKMIDDKKLYACDIETDNGTTFVNGVGETTLTAQVMDGITDITNKCAIQWYKNDIPVAPTKSITVSADDVQNKAVYRFVASNSSGTAIGRSESTITNINDGGNGIIVSADEPENPESGQLWQTESAEPIKRWDGDKWVIWYLDVTNLNVENLAAIAAIIGTVSNPYETEVESEWSNEALSGEITIGGAGIKNEYVQTSNGWKGMWRLYPQSYYAELRDANNTLKAATSISPEGYSVYSTRFGNQWLTLSDEMLYDTGWVEQTLMNGATGKIHARRYMKRKMIWFDNFKLNNGFVNITKLSGVFMPDYNGMYVVPIWSTAPTMEKIQFNSGDGMVGKITNNSGNEYITAFLEYY